jgi:hypothetical protein
LTILPPNIFFGGSLFNHFFFRFFFAFSSFFPQPVDLFFPWITGIELNRWRGGSVEDKESASAKRIKYREIKKSINPL